VLDKEEAKGFVKQVVGTVDEAGEKLFRLVLAFVEQVVVETVAEILDEPSETTPSG
jgi:hypothetical protein